MLWVSAEVCTGVCQLAGARTAERLTSLKEEVWETSRLEARKGGLEGSGTPCSS